MANLSSIEVLEKKFLLSKVEKQLIHELIINPREALSTVSKTLNKNRATVTKKLAQMLEKGIIKISINLNLDYFKNDFYMLRINLKSIEYAEKFFESIRKCPKIIHVSHSFIDNSFLVILRDEKHEALKNKYFSCMHFIEQIQADSKVENCQFETLLSPILPNYVTLDERVLKTNESKAPCKRDCTLCLNYLQTCPGCPATKHYQGNLKSSI